MVMCECGRDSSDFAGTYREQLSCPKLSGQKCPRCTFVRGVWTKCCTTGKCDGRGNELCHTCGGSGKRAGGLVLCNKRHDKKEGKMDRRRR